MKGGLFCSVLHRVGLINCVTGLFNDRRNVPVHALKIKPLILRGYEFIFFLSKRNDNPVCGEMNRKLRTPPDILEGSSLFQGTHVRSATIASHSSSGDTNTIFGHMHTYDTC